MKCPICNSEMECNQESYHYVESGLENVQLDGIDVFRCSCGEEIINIPAMPELHSLIALELIKKNHFSVIEKSDSCAKIWDLQG